MMDLGATVCTPRNPSCAICPLRKTCLASAKGLQDELPFKPKKKALPVRLAVAVQLSNAKNQICFTQRVQEKLLNGLWELPTELLSTPDKEAQALKILLRKLGLSSAKLTAVGEIEHIFSHFKSVTKLYRLIRPVSAGKIKETPTRCFAKPADLPLTTVTRRALAL
jgi:A/G-specific adenine glycosylase